MKNDLKGNTGIKALVKRYKKLFRIEENLNYYSESDFKLAERKFLKYVLLRGGIEFQPGS